MTESLPFAPASERNKAPILAVLRDHLEQLERVLEIGSCTGQHAVHFAAACPHLEWQTSDQNEYLDALSTQLKHVALPNTPAPFCLDVRQADWIGKRKRYDAVYTANTLHIMDADAVEAFFRGLNTVVHALGWLMVYGPFKYNGQCTTPSNQAFDESLRARRVGSGLRDFEWVDSLAQAEGFRLVADHAMPANNQCLIWRRA